MSDPERRETEGPREGRYSKEKFQEAEKKKREANEDWDKAEGEGLDEKDEESSDFAKKAEEAAEKKEELIDQARKEALEENERRKKRR